MEIDIRLNATEYDILYDKNIEQVCFYIHENCVVISGLDKDEKVISQFEVERNEFNKLSKLITSYGN